MTVQHLRITIRLVHLILCLLGLGCALLLQLPDGPVWFAALSLGARMALGAGMIILLSTMFFVLLDMLRMAWRPR